MVSGLFDDGRLCDDFPLRDITFDTDGDLELQVQCDTTNGEPESCSWRVCSRALARASPVFKRMLYGNFAESKPATGKWVVALHEDYHNGLAIAMHIIHGNYHELADNFEGCEYAGDNLYYVARVVDKYDMVHILQPWANTWIRKHIDGIDEVWQKAATHGMHRCDGQLIWIAWVLGDEVLLNHLLDVVFIHTCIVKKGQYKDPERRKLGVFAQDDDDSSGEFDLQVTSLLDNSDELASPLYNPKGQGNEVFNILNVAEQIEQRRLSVIMPVLTLLKPLVTEIVENMDAGHMGPGAPGVDKSFLTLDCGELGDGDDYLTIPLSRLYKGSMAELVPQVKELKKVMLHEAKYYRDRHKGVLRDIVALLNETLERHAVQLSESQKEHLRCQRARSGIILRDDWKKPAKDLVKQ